MRTFSRRSLVSTLSAFAVLGVLGRRLCSLSSDTGWVIKLPAKQMADRSLAFVNMFVNTYFKDKAPFPIYAFMVKAGIRPDDSNVAEAFGQRGDLVFHGNRLVSRDPKGKGITLPFHALINDQTVRFNVDLVSVVDIDVRSQRGTLGFTFTTPLKMTILDPIDFSGLQLRFPDGLLLNSVTITRQAISYSLRDSVGPGTYQLVLDLTSAGGAPVITRPSIANHQVSKVAILLCLAVYGGLSLGCEKQGPTWNDVVQDVCYTAPPPAGFFRKDSKASGLHDCPSPSPTFLNDLIYEKYTNIPISISREVCADDPVPTGWQSSASYHDDYGCDSAKYKGTKFDNVRNFTNVSATPVGP